MPIFFLLLSLATDAALHLPMSVFFGGGQEGAGVIPAGEFRINCRLFPSKKTHVGH